MKVRELIEQLEQCTDKDLEVFVYLIGLTKIDL